MIEENISQKVLAKIKKDKIEPKSRWGFIVKDYIVWGIVAVFLTVGSLSTSVLIYMIDNNDWDLYKQVGNSMLSFVFATLPYFWLVILIIFILVLYYAFKYTKGGYKFHAYSIIITTVLLSLVIGFLFYNIGLAQVIDNTFSEKVPLYQRLLNNKQRLLTQPDQGILSGQVTEIMDSTRFEIRDLHGNDWLIKTQKDLPSQFLFKSGLNVIIIGQQIDDHVFEAQQIRPMMRKQMEFFKRRIMPKHLNLAPERRFF
jgi:hypothetical protein